MELKTFKYLVQFHKNGKIVDSDYCNTEDEIKVLQAMARSKGCESEVLCLAKGEETIVMSSPKLTDSKKKPAAKEKWEKACRCVETGQIFPTIRDCSNRMGIPYMTIYNNIKNGNVSRGFHFVLDHSNSVHYTRQMRDKSKCKRKYICVTTGEIFESAKECIEKTNVSCHKFYNYLNSRKPINGLLYKKL
jgi:hypothetical protein